MYTGIMRTDVEAAIDDIKNRTLSSMPGDLGRLIYLASTRDYNTGRYYHEGLALRFTEDVAGIALTTCHVETFNRLSQSSLGELVHQIEIYISSTHAEPCEVLEVWNKLEPYRVAIPRECDQQTAEFFFSNIRVALAILAWRQKSGPDN